MLTTREAAAALGVSVRRVQALIQAGHLPAVKLGRDWFIKPEDLTTVQTRRPGRPRK